MKKNLLFLFLFLIPLQSNAMYRHPHETKHRLLEKPKKFVNKILNCAWNGTKFGGAKVTKILWKVFKFPTEKSLNGIKYSSLSMFNFVTGSYAQFIKNGAKASYNFFMALAYDTSVLYLLYLTLGYFMGCNYPFSLAFSLGGIRCFIWSVCGFLGITDEMVTKFLVINLAFFLKIIFKLVDFLDIKIDEFLIKFIKYIVKDTSEDIIYIIKNLPNLLKEALNDGKSIKNDSVFFKDDVITIWNDFLFILRKHNLIKQ